MTWQVKYAAKERVVHIEVSGPASVAEMVEIARAARDLARTHGVHAVLGDASQTSETDESPAS